MTDERTKRDFAVTELKEVYKILFADVVQAGESLAVTPSDFANRSFVRTYFAYVEGVVFLLREVLRATCDGTDILTASENATLNGQRLKKLDNGDEELVPFNQGMSESLKFMLRTYPKGHGINNYEPKLGSGWQSMMAAIKIRDRLMHPKSLVSLMLTQTEVVCIDGAREWWHESVRSLLSTCEQEDKRLAKLYGTP